MAKASWQPPPLHEAKRRKKNTSGCKIHGGNGFDDRISRYRIPWRREHSQHFGRRRREIQAQVIAGGGSRGQTESLLRGGSAGAVSETKAPTVGSEVYNEKLKISPIGEGVVVAATGRMPLLLENAGDEKIPQFQDEGSLRASRDARIGDRRAESAVNSVGAGRSAMEQTDGHAQE